MPKTKAIFAQSIWINTFLANGLSESLTWVSSIVTASSTLVPSLAEVRIQPAQFKETEASLIDLMAQISSASFVGDRGRTMPGLIARHFGPFLPSYPYYRRIRAAGISLCAPCVAAVGRRRRRPP